MPPSRLSNISLANVTVLVTHQIDAAYWHEWQLFGIPGGNQVNLLLNLPIIALVVYAQGRIFQDIRSGISFYKLLAALGFLTVGIHTFFLLRGSEAFLQPASIGLLIATFVLSIWQLIALRSLDNPAFNRSMGIRSS